MKNTRFLKLAMLVLVCALSVCAFAGVIANAEEAAPTAEITTANVAYNDMVQLAFTVTSANLPDGAVVGIMTWEADAVEFTAENAAYSTYKASEKDGVTYYKTAGIPAPEMDTAIYVAAVYKVGNDVTVAETPFKYSVLQYAGTRLSETNVSAKQADVYENLIKYGINSDAVFAGDENYAFVKTVNGTIGSAGAEIGGWMGKEVLLRAEAKNADGKYFIKWQNAEGETVSGERLTYVTVTEAGIAEYTAVYGDKAASAYASTYDFEALETGKLTTTPSGLSFSNNNGTNNQFYITESLNGDKQLLIDRLVSGSKSYSAFYKLPTGNQITAFEYDYELVESVVGNTNVPNQVTFTMKDGDGTEQNVRLNYEFDLTNEKLCFYLESSKGSSDKTLRDEDGKIAYLDTLQGSTMTIRYALDLDNIKAIPVEVVTEYKQDAEGNYLDAEGNVTTDSANYVAVSTATYTTYSCDLLVYVNGKFFAKADLSICDNNYTNFNSAINTFDENGTPSFLLDKNCTITGNVGIGSLNSANKDIALDNIMYYDLID